MTKGDAVRYLKSPTVIKFGILEDCVRGHYGLLRATIRTKDGTEYVEGNWDCLSVKKVGEKNAHLIKLWVVGNFVGISSPSPS